METLTLTKQQLLNALDLPFIKRIGSWSKKYIDGTCAVCAVGAVIHSLGVDVRETHATDFRWIATTIAGDWKFRGFFRGRAFTNAGDEALYKLSTGDWAGALSTVFEDSGLEAARELVNFHFPETVEISAEGVGLLKRFGAKLPS